MRSTIVTVGTLTLMSTAGTGTAQTQNKGPLPRKLFLDVHELGKGKVIKGWDEGVARHTVVHLRGEASASATAARG